jgi:hypothetical protein
MFKVVCETKNEDGDWYTVTSWNDLPSFEAAATRVADEMAEDTEFYRYKIYEKPEPVWREVPFVISIERV